jgi:acetyl-CoA carboxylase carboxyltransferase component
LGIQLKNRGDEVSEEERQQMLEDIQRRYSETADPRFAAARLWVDAIIDPAETRAVIARSLECAAANPEVEEFRTGVLQT